VRRILIAAIAMVGLLLSLGLLVAQASDLKVSTGVLAVRPVETKPAYVPDDTSVNVTLEIRVYNPGMNPALDRSEVRLYSSLPRSEHTINWGDAGIDATECRDGWNPNSRVDLYQPASHSYTFTPDDDGADDFVICFQGPPGQFSGAGVVLRDSDEEAVTPSADDSTLTGESVAVEDAQ
jgi:hypothetical protein